MSLDRPTPLVKWGPGGNALIDSYYPELFWYHPGFAVLSWSDAHLVAVAAGGRSGWAHSLRKLLAGSVRAARRAGMKHAASAVASIPRDTPKKVTVSVLVISNSRFAMKRVST